MNADDIEEKKKKGKGKRKPAVKIFVLPAGALA